MNPEQLIKELEKELQNILSFWLKETIDEENGGFIGRIDHFGQKDPEHPKGSVLNARILWTFSAAYRQFPEPAYKEAATRAFNYLLHHFVDRQKGGVYWSVDHKGQPLDTKKQIYALAFAVYGLTEYCLAFQDDSALKEAVSLFEDMEKYSFDTIGNGYFEAYTRDWVLMEDLRLSEKDANEKKTMNTHLHVLEAYTNLYRVYPVPFLAKQLKNLIRIFLDKIFNQQTGHLELFFDEDWRSKLQVISFGHDIEASWLMLEAAETLGEEELLSETEAVAIQIANSTLQEGFSSEGGLFYEIHEDGSLDEDKHWWPQAEALVGLYNAFQLTKDQQYLDQLWKTWRFIQENLIDRKNGEWYWKVDANGTAAIKEDKVGPWKCPYHNARAMMEVLNRLKKS